MERFAQLNLASIPAGVHVTMLWLINGFVSGAVSCGLWRKKRAREDNMLKRKSEKCYTKKYML